MSTGSFRFAGTTVSVLVLTASLAACAPAESNASSAQTAQTIQRLQAARQLDLHNALDPNVGPVASGDYSVRADDAARVASDLQHGQYVSQVQIDDALFVPPRSISPAQRAKLIDELKQAKDLDDQGWWDWTRDPIIAQDFSVQEKKASRAIRDLETNQQISWSEIDQGLQVPQYP
jgi:hypothetical protein